MNDNKWHKIATETDSSINYQLKRSLKDYSDEELKKELKQREKKRRGKILGYRSICHGDEYNYGGYTDYIIGVFGWDKKTCKERAENHVKESDHGGYVEEIYKDTLKPRKIN